jgi:hypothetical protein
MALLNPKHDRRRTSIKDRPFSTLRCPFNGHQVSWCRELCEPIEGHGYCGRDAPHLMIGRTQAAIAFYKRKSRS